VLEYRVAFITKVPTQNIKLLNYFGSHELKNSGLYLKKVNTF